MKYINTFKNHASYDEKLNVGGVDISLPNISYCEDVKAAHYDPYNTVEFYVDEITQPQTVKIYTDKTTSVPIQVSEGNKWYSYVLPKDKGLFRISGNTVNKVVVKADISFEGISDYPYKIIIPNSTIDASFKGSNTSNVTNMNYMFYDCSKLTSLDLSGWDTSKVTNGMANVFGRCKSLESLDLSGWDTSNVEYMDTMFHGCSGLTSLDLSGWNTSKVTDMSDMFNGCAALNKITMKGCSEATITKIQNQLKADGITGVTIVTE